MARKPGPAPSPDALQVAGDEASLLRPLAALLVQLGRAEIALEASTANQETTRSLNSLLLSASPVRRRRR